ncbi:response regulator transcription factor [Desulfuromonas sp.]|uniref:helix-turn-helix transcriptional regulator n=1 Tax=Desulfuromonas sp. TaxID=892 RepID=UPI0025B7C613|nr:response regulator transcription factor [Desulfuromonas sp.]
MVDTLAKVPSGIAGPSSRRNLVLFECFGLEVVEILALLQGDLHAIASQYLVALFNLRAGSGVEKTALQKGVRGYFYEKDSMAIVNKGIDSMLAGELWVTRQVLEDSLLASRDSEVGKARFPQKNGPGNLTSREVDVLALLTGGATNEGIAERLCISVNTVRTHVYNIFKKIKVNSRLQASLWAAENL